MSNRIFVVVVQDRDDGELAQRFCANEADAREAVVQAWADGDKVEEVKVYEFSRAFVPMIDWDLNKI